MRCYVAHGDWGYGSMMRVLCTLLGHGTASLSPSWGTPSNQAFTPAVHKFPFWLWVDLYQHFQVGPTLFITVMHINWTPRALWDNKLEWVCSFTCIPIPRKSRATASCRQYIGFLWLVMSVSSPHSGPLEKNFTKQRQTKTWSPNSQAMKNSLTSPPSLMLEQRSAAF